MQEGAYQCEQCSASFQRREHYQRHVLTHTKERPFSCTECGQSFARVDSLTRHCATLHFQTSTKSSGERRRVARACKPCNLAKLRCDGQHPCDRCCRYGEECYYEQRHKRRMTGHASSLAVPHAKRHQRHTPHETQTRPSSRGLFHSTAHSSLATGNQGTTDVSPHHGAVDLPDPDGFLIHGSEHAATQAATLNYQRPLDQESPKWENLLDLEGLSTGGGLDASIWPGLPDLESSIDRFNNIWLASTQPPLMPDATVEASQMPTPLTPAALVEIYDRGCSPGPSNQEASEPRQYNPTAIDVDAQLTFPDLQKTSPLDMEQEDFAHVQESQQGVVDEVARLAAILDTKPMLPPFKKLRIPPAPVLNVWTQLYFEHFHPVFPILHKATFGYPDTHWLLVFTVSAIGAQFSQIRHAQACARAMHEMIRRQSMYLCENKNKTGRELWLTQVIILNHLGLKYSGERRALELAEMLQALPVTLARRKQLFIDILSSKKLVELDLSLHQRWQIWALDEERRRTAFAIWLADSSFQSHFDLTPVLCVGEVQNSLPRGEEPWAASSPGGWASFSILADSNHPFNLEQVVREGAWIAAWKKTGVLGKQVLLQLLTSFAANDRRLFSFGFQNTPSKTDAETLLQDLLATTEDEGPTLSTLERKANVSYRLMILSALISHSTSRPSLLSTAMRIRYQHCRDKELDSLAKEWNSAPQTRRRAISYAAQAFETVRSHYCAHFSTPVVFFRATLALWLHAILGHSQDAAGLSSIVLGAPGLSHITHSQWVESGTGVLKLRGIGNILSSSGRKRLLDEAISVMRTIRSWGISKIYAQLLTQLREDEQPPSTA